MIGDGWEPDTQAKVGDILIVVGWGFILAAFYAVLS